MNPTQKRSSRDETVSETDLRIAERMDRVFDLRMEGFSPQQIAKEEATSVHMVRSDIRLLKTSVSERTKRELSCPPCRTGEVLERAYLANELFDFLYSGARAESAACRISVTRDQIYALRTKFLDKAVSAKTRTELRRPETSLDISAAQELAAQMNRVFDLKQGANTATEIAEITGNTQSQVEYLLACLKKSVNTTTAVFLGSNFWHRSSKN